MSMCLIKSPTSVTLNSKVTCKVFSRSIFSRPLLKQFIWRIFFKIYFTYLLKRKTAGNCIYLFIHLFIFAVA